MTGFETGESDLCCGICCCCKEANVKLKTSQSIPYYIPCIGKISIPILYDVPSPPGIDQAKLQDYVYGAVQKNAIELHAANHLLKAGITKHLTVREDLKALLSPESSAMDRSGK